MNEKCLLTLLGVRQPLPAGRTLPSVDDIKLRHTLTRAYDPGNLSEFAYCST